MSREAPPAASDAGTAVVVGMSGPTGLAVVRALAPHGVTCHAVHPDGSTLAMATRLAQRAVCPDWRRDPEAFVSFLLDLASRLRAGTEAGGGAAGEAAPPLASVFVCDDAALDAVWPHADQLRAAGLRATFTSRRSLTESLDKRTQMAAAAKAGVAVPWTRWGTAEELQGVADECPYPAILKPAFSHLGVKALGAKALRCATADEVRAALERVAGVEVLLQEYVPGGDDELYTAGLFVCDEGHVAFTGRKLKQHPPGLGIARLAEQVDAPALIPGSVALLKELGYEGISQVEYKRDQRDGSYRLMEANFRPWIWIGLATACGTNLPLAAHRWARGDESWRAGASPAGEGRTRAPRPASRPRRWVWAIPEGAYTLRDLRRGTLPRFEQWRGMRAEAFYSRSDPAPFRRALTDGIANRLGGREAGRRLRGACRALRQALTVPAVGLAAAALWSDWRRAGRRSVAGARPAVGLPGPGPALVLTPHPDDETIMCGATIAALARRDDHVRVVGVTTGAATAVGLPGGSPSDAATAERADMGQTRAAELRAACLALGVDDVAVWDFADGAVPVERARLAARIGDELDAVGPALVVVPFPFDAHADHVAVAVALADALAARRRPDEHDPPAAAQLPRVAAAAVRTPLSPDWATRLVPAGPTWAARQAAVAAHVSRGPSVFATSTLLCRLHPARPLRRVEAFAELSPAAYVGLARAMEAEGLTEPSVRGGGHVLSVAAKLRRTRGQRDRIGALLRAAVAGRAGDDPSARTG